MVLANLSALEVKPGETVTQSIHLRKNQLPLPEYGKIDPALFSNNLNPGMILAWVDPDKEPTRHLIADLKQKKNEFEQWKGQFKMIFTSEAQMKIFIKAESLFLPKNISYTLQSSFPLKTSDIKLSTGELKNLPVVLYVNKEGVINYRSEGYRIGTGDELLTFIK
jgi:hypothetical protein